MLQDLALKKQNLQGAFLPRKKARLRKVNEPKIHFWGNLGFRILANALSQHCVSNLQEASDVAAN